MDGARVVGKQVRAGAKAAGIKIKSGAQAAGRGAVVGGAVLVGGVKTLTRRMLPGAEKSTKSSRPPRPIPKENPVVMMTIAIAILLLVIVIVVWTYNTFGTQARVGSLISRARAEEAQAQQFLAAGAVTEARAHWNAVLDYAVKVAELQPNSAEMAQLQNQAQQEIDKLDGVVRLTFLELGELGMSEAPRRLVVHGQSVFVLDPVYGWVAQVDFSVADDGAIESEQPIFFVNTTMEIDGGAVGSLVDLVWVDPGSSRMAGGLVILEQQGGLVGYDPAWEVESGEPHLTRSLLGAPKTNAPKAIDAFEGRLYVLDPDGNQIWRYEPEGELYPNQPGHYFVVAPARSLAGTQDMTIDANIYVLYSDGAIFKYLSGEPQSFNVTGVPEGFNQPVALTVDQNGNSGRVYVADKGNRRVVVLEPDGVFVAQFKTDVAFDSLEAVAVDETAERFYAFSGDRLYMASLPRLPSRSE
jgi:hypothetical protein